jgi:hypothetical protein
MEIVAPERRLIGYTEEAGVPACEQKELAGQASANKLEDPAIG